MKAIQVLEPNKMEMVDVEEPQIEKEGQVKVKVRAFGICGSDVGIFKGTNPFCTYPRVLGHEISGQVIEVGSGVEDLKVGDKVVLEPIEFCGKCYACTHDNHNVCKDLEVYGVHRDGGFCEFLVTDQSKWHKVDDSLSFVEAAVAEPYTIAEEATTRTNVQEGDLVLITGAGPMGLLAADVAKMKGAKVIISELNENRLKISKEFGADYLVNPGKRSLTEEIREITDEGVNVFIDTTGVISVISEGMENMSPASRFVSLAFGSENIPLNFKTLNQKEIVITGSRLQYEKFPIVTSFLKDKKDLLSKFITHVYKAEDFREAFENQMKKDTSSIKTVLTFD